MERIFKIVILTCLSIKIVIGCKKTELMEKLHEDRNFKGDFAKNIKEMNENFETCKKFIITLKNDNVFLEWLQKYWDFLFLGPTLNKKDIEKLTIDSYYEKDFLKNKENEMYGIREIFKLLKPAEHGNCLPLFESISYLLFNLVEGATELVALKNYMDIVKERDDLNKEYQRIISLPDNQREQEIGNASEVRKRKCKIRTAIREKESLMADFASNEEEKNCKYFELQSYYYHNEAEFSLEFRTVANLFNTNLLKNNLSENSNSVFKQIVVKLLIQYKENKNYETDCSGFLINKLSQIVTDNKKIKFESVFTAYHCVKYVQHVDKDSEVTITLFNFNNEIIQSITKKAEVWLPILGTKDDSIAGEDFTSFKLEPALTLTFEKPLTITVFPDNNNFLEKSRLKPSVSFAIGYPSYINFSERRNLNPFYNYGDRIKKINQLSIVNFLDLSKIGGLVNLLIEDSCVECDNIKLCDEKHVKGATSTLKGMSGGPTLLLHEDAQGAISITYFGITTSSNGFISFATRQIGTDNVQRLII